MRTLQELNRRGGLTGNDDASCRIHEPYYCHDAILPLTNKLISTDYVIVLQHKLVATMATALHYLHYNYYVHNIIPRIYY